MDHIDLALNQTIGFQAMDHMGVSLLHRTLDNVNVALKQEMFKWSMTYFSNMRWWYDYANTKAAQNEFQVHRSICTTV